MELSFVLDLGTLRRRASDRHNCFGHSVAGEEGEEGFWFSQLTRRKDSFEGCDGSCRPSTVRTDENADKDCETFTEGRPSTISDMAGRLGLF